VRRRWQILIGTFGAIFIAAAAPIVWVETSCNEPLPGTDFGAAYTSRLQGDEGRRAEVQSWLTYPEWYIVYSAETYGRFLTDGNRPSAFAHGRQIRGFWSGLCTVNRAAAAGGGSGHYKTMLYTIGISFSAEMIVKAVYENTIGRLTEWIGGWDSGNDRFNAGIWRDYAAFMHETPWYRFPFTEAVSGLWSTGSEGRPFRHWERRLALSTEYGVKAGYAGLIGWASGTALGQDERTLRFVARGEPAAFQRVDARLRPVERLDGGLIVIEAPRYAQFTDLMQRLAGTNAELVEIAGNDDIFVTLRLPEGAAMPAGGIEMISVPLDDRPGWRRVGVTAKVPQLLPLLRATSASGGEIEHVYDY